MSRIHSCVLPVAHCVSELPEIVFEKERLLSALQFSKLHFSFRDYWVQR